MKIKHCRMFEPLKVSKDDTVQVVAKKMDEHHVRHAYVCEDDKCEGIISVTDLTKKVVAENKKAGDIKAKEIMESPVQTKDVEDNVKDVYEFMSENKRYSLAITKDGKLVGILPMNEVVAVMLARKNEE